MRSVTPPGDRPIRRLPLLVWGWAMLLVVLLSAAPTGGAPRTAVVGSAFDPATISVALHPKPLKLNAGANAADEKKRDDGFSTDAPVIVGPSGFGTASVVLSVAVAAPPDRRRDATPPASPFSRAHAPRAPPAA